MDKVIQAIIGAIIAWAVPKLLNCLLARGKRENGKEADLTAAFPWVRWCVAHLIAGGAGGFLSALLGVAGMNTPGGVGNWTVFGVVIGIGQWMILKPYGNFGPFWAVASALGWSIWSVFQAAQAPGYFGWATAGLAVGILQWMMLRRERGRAYLWIPANLAAWLAAGTLGFWLGMGLAFAGVHFALVWIIGWSAVGLFGSLVLGWAMGRMPKKK